MDITAKLKQEHDDLLEKIKNYLLSNLEDNPPKANVATQRVKQFVALNDLECYIKRYDPKDLNSKAYSQHNSSNEIYNYFEDEAINELEKYKKKHSELFNVRGIDLLEQGFLNEHKFQAYGVFQLAHYWGSNQSYSFQKINNYRDNIYVHFMTEDREFTTIEKVFDRNSDKTKIAIMSKGIQSVVGGEVYIFHRVIASDKFSVIGKYLILPEYSLNQKNKKFSYITVQKINTLSSIDKQNILIQDIEIIPDYKESNDEKITRVYETYPRDPTTRDKSINRAKGQCENDNCTNKTPFLNKDNEVFLESHHIIFRSEKGSDTLDNMIALCPNCHREAHYGQNRDKLKKQFQKTIQQKY